MNKIFTLIALLTLFGSTIYAQNADQNTKPITQKEKRLEATIVCLDAVQAPTKYNEFAKQFITYPSFPKKEKNISESDYKAMINDWLVAHPLLVNQIVIERKKAHDKLYGYRPY